MHASSMENMHKALQRYVGADFLSGGRRRIVDVGSNCVNGSYRQLFSHWDVDYVGLDIARGEGVDVIIDDPYAYPMGDASADLVLSGQMLEHCEYPWMAMQEMVRILAPDGYLILIVPSAGPIRRYPVDCYRFLPDCLPPLARLMGCHVVATWRDERGPWCDVVGVFSKNPGKRDMQPEIWPQPPPNGPFGKSRPEHEVVFGSAPYLTALESIHRTLQPDSYLEIGVRAGASLGLAECPSVAIDPWPDPRLKLGPQTRLYRSTSDDFFDFEADQAIVEPIDLAFIDGMHHFEFVLRDFIQIEQRCAETSVIVIDDIFPNAPEQARRDRTTRVWTGDVWKILLCLKQYRPDLHLVALDTRPTGLLVAMGLTPNDRRLTELYNRIVAIYAGSKLDQPPDAILQRSGATSPDDPRLTQALGLLRSLRRSRVAPTVVRRRLACVLSTAGAAPIAQ